MNDRIEMLRQYYDNRTRHVPQHKSKKWWIKPLRMLVIISLLFAACHFINLHVESSVWKTWIGWMGCATATLINYLIDKK